MQQGQGAAAERPADWFQSAGADDDVEELMEASQVLSPTLRLVKRRWGEEGRAGTSVSVDSATVVDAAGQRVTWARLMEGLVPSTRDPANHRKQVPVHPSVETFETVLLGKPALGARVRGGCQLAPDTFLGLYQGGVGAAAEAELLAGRGAPLGDRGACCGGRGWPAAEALRRRAVHIARMHSYTVRVAQVDVGHGRTKVLVTSATGPDGRFIGNELGRINDGRANPFVGREHSGPLTNDALLGDETSGAASDRPANAAFVQILHEGWVYLGVLTTAWVLPREELLLDYSDGYWAVQRDLHRQLHRLTAICQRAPADQPFSIAARWTDASASLAARWTDAWFLVRVWAARAHEDARAGAAVQRDMHSELGRARALMLGHSRS